MPTEKALLGIFATCILGAHSELSAVSPSTAMLTLEPLTGVAFQRTLVGMEVWVYMYGTVYLRVRTGSGPVSALGLLLKGDGLIPSLCCGYGGATLRTERIKLTAGIQ